MFFFQLEQKFGKSIVEILSNSTEDELEKLRLEKDMEISRLRKQLVSPKKASAASALMVSPPRILSPVRAEAFAPPPPPPPAAPIPPPPPM